MADVIHALAALPELRMCESLAVLDLATVRRFWQHYGLIESDPDSGDLIPLSAIEICLHRLYPQAMRERRRPKSPTCVLTTSTKANVMASRETRGEGLRHPRDLMNTQITLDFVARDVVWNGQPKSSAPDEPGWTGGPIAGRVYADGVVNPEQERLLRKIRVQEEKAA